MKNYLTATEYHQVFSDETSARMQTIRKAIHEVAPDAIENIRYQVPCFKYPGSLIYYCAFPNHISLSLVRHLGNAELKLVFIL